MKNIWIALVLLLTVSACLPDKKGKKDPEPDLSGRYAISRLVVDNATPPLNLSLPADLSDGRRLSAVVVVSKLSDTQIRFHIDTDVDGRVEVGSNADVTIQKASGRDYDLIKNGNRNRVGFINGTDFSIDVTQAGKRTAIIAKK
ncbi:hypothetical protein [Spirosoma utsteinense]|uniref:Uncharacterized protein n=1 Tax=Spirosoma utsteinense TaxID=2585773 RepID=A0ABR6WAG4_9BACT|nr:hypothetical protein [Spirosoma utsteinense]MBC3787255.1 hypothetical protein [Spirosoma utsteinense]MBC3792941.1 hypothetical protein [Spirosoma utsteinense]